MKYYLIAGEASGDLHGSNLMQGLQAEDDAAEFRIWGGDLMEAQGGQLVKHYRDLAFMGFWEVLINIRTILGNIKLCKRDILTYEPDVLILIDYPGFNLRIAKWAKARGLRVFYYISPQIWAWHSSRVHGIKASVERMFVILPFEREFYAKYNYEVDYVGHPLVDVVQAYEAPSDFRPANQLPADQPLIALLPGSRKQEIERLLNVMLSVVPDFPGHQFVIAGAPSQPPSFYQEVIQQAPLSREAAKRVRFVENQTYALLQHAEAALVTSGTATLETAFFEVPQVVCYKGSPLSYYIARQVVNVDYISLVNLIAEREIVTELIQEDCNSKRIQEELSPLLSGSRRQEMKKDYASLKTIIGKGGASRKAARLMVGYAQGAISR